MLVFIEVALVFMEDSKKEPKAGGGEMVLQATTEDHIILVSFMYAA
jgi:hypothetical protein